MNTIFIYANKNKHSNDRHCYHNNHERSISSLQSYNPQHKPRIQIDVSKNYTGKEFRLLEHKKTL